MVKLVFSGQLNMYFIGIALKYMLQCIIQRVLDVMLALFLDKMTLELILIKEEIKLDTLFTCLLCSSLLLDCI